jgi:RNA polymerase sigma-70 factor, ECF subfamily
MEVSNQKLIEGIRNGDLASFEELYHQYYVFLCLVAEHIVRNHSDAEEIVSDVFVKLWNIRQQVDISVSLKGYLVKAVHNTSLNYLEKNKMLRKHDNDISLADHKLLAWGSDYPLGKLYEKEILSLLEKGIAELPEACREIFQLSRSHDLKYSEIASRLGISENTVKTQMKIALSRLKESLKDYLIILIIFLLY